ncbi:myosin-binding protein H-like isoform X11 [Bubalus kerabau]|uniref:myosin-binding protein H-like isoform X11 n=1 Tax=Bubalus carabanensis TaxID=3119969 RepID=UPI00244EE30A|nr:myosin-binding protein H-like isoform X11 [Bubalus carabanensis]
MEAATAPEAALRPTLKVKEASPADADGPQASPQRGTGSPLPQLLPPIEEHPKIWLPRALRQTYIRKVGDTVNLLIPFQGKPKPQAIWTRDGCALDTSRVSVRNGDRDSILFIREAQRADSGRYQLSVQLGGLEATATIDILVIGNSYAFRVFAENKCGLSENAPVTADLAHIQKAATVYRTEGFAQRDFSEAPKFTQPLADCTTVIGYDTQLFCCVRASPKMSLNVAAAGAKSLQSCPTLCDPVDCSLPGSSFHGIFQPKIIWLKNKMDIQGNPKYRALTHLGICSLEIRKPGPFDGGIYTCKAVNPLGEASVDCRVDVKGRIAISALQRRDLKHREVTDQFTLDFQCCS